DLKGWVLMSEQNKSVASGQLHKPVRKEPKQISFRVSENEYSKLKQSAETLNLSVPQFVKSKALGSRLVRPKFDKETRTQIAKELSGIGNNLNQISRVLNIKTQKNEDIPNEDLIRNFNILREEVNKLWRSLN